MISEKGFFGVVLTCLFFYRQKKCFLQQENNVRETKFKKNKIISLMARNIFSIVVLVIVVVVSSVLGACTQEEVANNLVAKKPDVVTGKKYIQTLVHHIDNQRSEASDNMDATCEIQTIQDGAVINSYKTYAHPTMKASIFVMKNDYTITEEQVNCSVVSCNILRNQSSKAVADGGTEVSDTVVINVSDGQVVKLPSTVTTFKTSDYTYGTVELKNANVVSIENTEISTGTRAASYVKATLRTTYTVDLTYAEKNTAKDTVYTVRLMTTASRRVIADNEIESLKAENKNRVVIDDNTERCSFDEVITMTSGEVVRNTKSIILNREFKGIEAYDKFVSNFAFSLAKVNGVASGKDEKVRDDAGWTIYGKTDKYSSNISNGVDADAFSTDYSFYHERASFRDNNLEVTFGYEDVRVSESVNKVSNVTSDKSGYDKAIYDNGVRTVYIGYTQNIAEQVSLYKAARTILGYDYRDGKLVVNDNNVIASVVFVTRYSDATEKTEKVSKTFSRSLKCTSNWKAYENEETQFTHMLNVVLSASKKMNDGGWSWNEETRNITNIANLVGSEQTNSWVASVPNNITFTREGQTYTFDVIKFDVTGDGGKVTLASQSEEMDVYNYAATVSVAFGDNTVSSTAPGTIIVAKSWTPDFPSEWGKFVSAVGTVAVNESNNGWVYTWSLHFTNGTLPVIVGRDAVNAVVDQSLFEYDTNSKLNGAVFKDNRWSNSIAEDKKHYMLWSNSEGVAQGSMIYATATMWNWNNGHNTVFTSDFTFSVENGGKKLVVKKNGKEFATYRTAAK